MSSKTALIAAIAGLVLCVAAFQGKTVDVTGDWEMTLVFGPGGGPPGGGQMPPMVITFVQKGEALEAKMNNPMTGEEMKGTGKVVGNEIEFTFAMQGPGGEMSIVHKGKVDGDAMKGTIAMGERGEMEWTAKRVKK